MGGWAVLGHGFDTSSTRRLLQAGAVAFGLFVIAAFAYVWQHRDDGSTRDYLQILGGGFVYNYRVNDVYYGFTAKVVRPVPVGTIIEAAFEDPSGGPDVVVRERMGRMTTRYALRTPPLKGIVKDRPYKVSIRLLQSDGTEPIWQTSREYRSNIDEDVMPDGPLTTGPGYTPAPAGARLMKQQ